MITNPQVGMKVMVSGPMHPLFGQKGKLVRANLIQPSKWWVMFDGTEHYGEDTCISINDLIREPLTPEEQDQINRQEHANKYL